MQPAIHFKEVRHDLGKVAQEDRIAYVFEFSNTGDQPLIVNPFLRLHPAMASSAVWSLGEKGKSCESRNRPAI
jgi:hypothetical protein